MPVWTYTHGGRGLQMNSDYARYAIKAVREAFDKAKDDGGVQVVVDEDVYLTPSSVPKNELGVGIAKTAAEALRLWWNSYGWCGWLTEEAAEIIYQGGDGPDGIGGFDEPEVEPED